MDMNPLEKIKNGISKQDWGLVCEGYNAMTGQDLSLPTQPNNISPFLLEVPFDNTTIQLFKDCMRQMIDEFEFVQTVMDKPDTEDHIAETCDVSQPANNDDVEQPAGDDEENVDFNEVTESVEKIGLFGNTTVLITEKPKKDQIEENQKRYANRKGPKVTRPPPKIYQVECNNCEKTFDSRIKSGEFGQKCPSCLRSMRRDQ